MPRFAALENRARAAVKAALDAGGARLAEAASHLDALPFLGGVTPPLARAPSAEDLAGFGRAQDLALRCAAATQDALRPGWSERRTAAFIRAWLGDHGVRAWFHRPFAWFGDRGRFAGMAAFRDLRATKNVLGENDAYILDFGPVVDGFACDVSVSGVVGEVPGFAAAQSVLARIRAELPAWVDACGQDGARVWERVSNAISEAGFEPIHKTSPYSFLGHRMHKPGVSPLAGALARHDRQTFLEYFARGMAGQLLTRRHKGRMTGVWAVEPHLGGQGFGAKFEELMVVTDEGARWLRPGPVG